MQRSIRGAAMMLAVAAALQFGDSVCAQESNLKTVFDIEGIDNLSQTRVEADELLRMSDAELKHILMESRRLPIQDIQQEIDEIKKALQKEKDPKNINSLNNLLEMFTADLEEYYDLRSGVEYLKNKADRMQEFTAFVDSVRADALQYVSSGEYLVKLQVAGHGNPEMSQQLAVRTVRGMSIDIPYNPHKDWDDASALAPVAIVTSSTSILIRIQSISTLVERDRMYQIIFEEIMHLIFSIGASDWEPTGTENITENQKEAIREVFGWVQPTVAPMDPNDSWGIGQQISQSKDYLNNLAELAAKSAVFSESLQRLGITGIDNITPDFVAERYTPTPQDTLFNPTREEVWVAIEKASQQDTFTSPEKQIWEKLLELHPDHKELQSAVMKILTFF